MARENNFLLGHGDRLTSRVNVPSGGGDKNPPYTFEGARKRLSTRLQGITASFDALPRDATPRDEVVAVMMMHPRYVSKTDFPQELLSSIGLRTVGSRNREISPDRWGIEKHPKSAIAEELFVAGKREAFRRWSAELGNWTPQTRGAGQISHLEDLAVFAATDKLRGFPSPAKDETGILEVVIHNARSRAVVDGFLEYAKKHGARPIENRRRDIRGLTFIPVESRFDQAEELARFSFLRVIRPLPTLRPLRPGLARSVAGLTVTLPSSGPLNNSFRALVFDGGLPATAVTALQPWVKYVEPPGIGAASPAMQEHGLAVTAALLFGHVFPPGNLLAPICGVDHVRVTDVHTNGGPHLEYVDVLDRILAFLDSNAGKYEFINISLGPNLPVADDEVNVWTASLDDRLASGRAIATVAAGNDGELDGSLGLNRIQPPADAINVIAVGASDTLGETGREPTTVALARAEARALSSPTDWRSGDLT